MPDGASADARTDFVQKWRDGVQRRRGETHRYIFTTTLDVERNTSMSVGTVSLIAYWFPGESPISRRCLISFRQDGTADLVS